MNEYSNILTKTNTYIPMGETNEKFNKESVKEETNTQMNQI